MLLIPRLILLSLLIVIGLICVCPVATAAESSQSPYRRMIEAETMDVQGRGYAVQASRHAGAGAAVAVTTSQADASGRMTMKLEKQLPPGQYLVWVLLYIEQPASRKGDPLEMKASLGQAAASASVERDGSAALNMRIIVDAAKPFDALSLSMVTPVSHLLVDRVYLSSQVTDFSIAIPQRNHFTVGVSRIRQEVMGEAPSTFATGNVIANGSFEAGLPTYDWSTPYQSSYTLTPQMLSDDSPWHGSRFLRVPMYPYLAKHLGEKRDDQPTQVILLHRMLHLRPGTTYNFSGQFRSDAPVDVQLWLDPAYPDPNHPVRSAPRGSGKTGTSWLPITGTFTTPDNTNGYMLRLVANAPGPATLDIDGLMLSESEVDAQTFEPAAPLEVGVTWLPPGRVFHADESVSFGLELWQAVAAGESKGSASIRLRVMDYEQRLVHEETVERDASGAIRFELPTGAYRLLIDGRARVGDDRFGLPMQEYTFAVVDRPPAKMHGTLGSYITLAPQPIEIMSRAGVRSTTTLSASNDLLQNWRVMEPQQGEYVWIDKAVAHALEHDVKIIGNLDFSRSEPTIPQFAFDPDAADALVGGYPGGKRKFSREAWARFVEALTRHYAGSVDDWLVLDEPFHTITPQEYVELLKTTYVAAKKGNPNCRVIAHGGYYASWLPDVEKGGGQAYFDGISDYARNPAQAQRLRDFAQKHDKFLFTVEYEWNASLYHTLKTPQTDWDRTAPWYQHPTQVSMLRALSSMSWAHAIKFQRYDARYPGGDMTQLDLYKSLFEQDGSLKPAGVAYAIAAQILDGFAGAGELPLNTAFRSLLFESPEAFVIVLATQADELIQTAIDLPDGVTMRNLMGRQIKSGDLLLSHALVYVTGPRSKLAEVQAQLRQLETTPALNVEAQTVADDATGAQVLVLKLTNETAKPMAVTLAMTADVVREFWRSVRTSPVIEPGSSVEMRVELNAYANQPLPVRDARLELFVDGHALAMQVGDVYRPGQKKLSR